MSVIVRVNILFSAALLFVVQALPAQNAQQPPQETIVVTRDPSAAELLQRCWVAMGSPNPTLPLKAQADISPLIQGASPAQFTLETNGSEKMRTDTSQESAVHTFIVADGQGFMSGDTKNNPSSYTASLHPHPQWLPYALCGSPLNDPNMSISYVGPVAVNGVNTDHLQIYVEMVDSTQHEDGLERRLSQVDIFLNHNTGLPVRAQSWSFSMHEVTNSMLWTTDYTSYTRVQGIMLPSTTVEWVGHQKVLQYDWTSIVLNAPLESDTFAIGR